jgi:hypothetical protein
MLQHPRGRGVMGWPRVGDEDLAAVATFVAGLAGKK